MNIAIIDCVNQDIGLKILFPKADYYVNNIELDKKESLKKYNIKLNYNYKDINDKKYNYLFIIIALYDAYKGRKYFKKNIYNILQNILKIINSNNFKKVFIFDNYDYDYDPNEILKNNKIDLFFKRNYNKNKNYEKNVVPFPFIMFGKYSLIEKLDNIKENKNKIDRIFFSGNLFNHFDEQINYIRNRKLIYNKIKEYIYNPGKINYSLFLKNIRDSKFSLDLNGVGDPNKRTFEILSQNSLMISEFNNLKWPFVEEFSEETIFKNEIDFYNKINKLRNDNELYLKCLSNQKKIFNKYFNKEWIKKYILNFLFN